MSFDLVQARKSLNDLDDLRKEAIDRGDVEAVERLNELRQVLHSFILTSKELISQHKAVLDFIVRGNPTEEEN